MSEVRKHALSILRESLGRQDANFREHQWEAISAVVERRQRLLVVQRTGWGKSAVYFIATRMLRERGAGPTIILSPLLALMRNQIASARTYGVRLGTINSSNDKEINEATKNALLANELDAVIISPELLANQEFADEVLPRIANRVGLLVIDEAHCISDWGHDFRPDYKRIVNILKSLPRNLPVVATTATANQRVMEDVTAQLGDEIEVLRGQLTRESIQLQSIYFPKRSQRLAWLADTLPKLEGTGIIYAATTRAAEMVAAWLKTRGIEVAAYHSGDGFKNIEGLQRKLDLEDALLNNDLKALVATSALGMGYDKPDLSFVIHYQSPGSVVGYYQQVGRAGRGIPKAYGVLLSGDEDKDIQEYFIQQAFPKPDVVDEILTVLDSTDEGCSISEVCRSINVKPKKVEHAVRFLAAESPAPILVDGKPRRYKRTLRDYTMPHAHIRRLCERKQREWERMQEYLEHQGCSMQFLAQELDDDETTACGRCQGCHPAGALTREYMHETAVAAAKFIENQVIKIVPRQKAGTKANVAHRWPEYQFDNYFGELEHEVGRALCRWGEAGWGEIVMHGKRRGKLDPRLVNASVRLMRERWKPEPFPTWVAYVSSLSHPKQVPDFAISLIRNETEADFGHRMVRQHCLSSLTSVSTQ